MKLDTQSRPSSLIKIWYDKRNSEAAGPPAFCRIAILKKFNCHKNAMQSLSKNKTCKSLKEVMVSWFNVKL